MRASPAMGRLGILCRAGVAAVCAAVAASSLQPAAGATVHEAWVARFNGHADLGDSSSSTAIAAGRVFVTGGSTSGPQLPEPYDSDIVTIAYSAATGAQLWKRTYDGPAHSADNPTTVMASPDGSTV